MLSFSLFILSGAALITLALAKRYEEKKRKSIFILKAISKGDERARDSLVRLLHFYSIGKEKAEIFIKKQLPLRTKNWRYKSISYLKENAAKYLGDMRNSKLIKRSDGISEFFKNISEIEKGNGEINEVYTEPTVEEVAEEPAEPVKKKRAPAPRKIKVIETL